MKITKVRIKKFANENSNVKGLAEVTLDDCFVVNSIRIVEKPEKMVVAMPSRTITNRFADDEASMGKKIHKDFAHPINQETREMFNEVILGAYERADSNDYVEEL